MTHAEILQRKRRVSLTVEEMVLVASTLAVSLAHFPIAINLKARLMAMVDEEHDPDHRRIVDAYRAADNTRDSDCEIDDDAEVSPGEDPGAYVMIWKWVPAAAAGIPSACSECGMHYDEPGKLDVSGMCESCADAT